MKEQTLTKTKRNFILKQVALGGLFCFLLNPSNKAWALPTCNGNEIGEARQSCQKEWSAFIYMAADNDLTPYAYWDLYEMERQLPLAKNLGASKKNLDVLVELDTSATDGRARYLIQQNEQSYSPQISIEDFRHFSRNDISSPLLQILPETDTPLPPNPAKIKFESFLHWGIEHFPAKHYFVVIWGHGEGFIGKQFNGAINELVEEFVPVGSSIFLDRESVSAPIYNFSKVGTQFPKDKVFGGVAFDYSDQTFLDIPSIGEVLADLSKNTLLGKKIDLLSFDACLMQTIEVAKELSPYTKFIVGSTQVQNYLGLPYRFILDELNDTTPMTAYDLAKAIPSLFEKSFRPEGYQGKVDPKARLTYTISALSTEELDLLLTPALEEVRIALKNYATEDLNREMELLFILENSPTFRGESRDLGIFLGTLKKLLFEERHQSGFCTEMAQKLEQAIDKALSALNRTMINYAYGDIYVDPTLGGFNVKNNYILGFFKGISVWLPVRQEYYKNREKEFTNYPVLFRPSIWE